MLNCRCREVDISASIDKIEEQRYQLLVKWIGGAAVEHSTLVPRESLSMTFFIHTRDVRLSNNVIITKVLQDSASVSITSGPAGLNGAGWSAILTTSVCLQLNAGKPVWSAMPRSRAV